jgi:hypothetical protein
MINEVKVVELPRKQKIFQYSHLFKDNFEIGMKVSYNGKEHEIISIYSPRSPLCGYVLLCGIGSPILATDIINQKQL